MAFNIKNAEENYFNALPGNVTDAYLRDDFSSNCKRFEELSTHFSFALTNSQKTYLNSCGIQIAPIASKTHPHPVSKTVENHIIFNILPGLLSNYREVAFFSIKSFKADYIWKKINDECNGTVYNRLIDSKDRLRFDKCSIIKGGLNNFDLFLHNLEKRFNHAKFRRPEAIFLHDEIHYWSKEQLVGFLLSTKVDVIIATCVYPPELLANINKSMNTSAYSFKKNKDGKSISFWPDDSPGQPYVQPADCWLLKTNSLRILDESSKEVRVFSISLIESIGAHHVLSIQSGPLLKESERHFRNFDCCDLKNFETDGSTDLGEKLNQLQVRHWVLNKILSYIICLKKSDVESALAKLRQLTDSNPTPDEVLVVNDFISILLRYKLNVVKRKPYLNLLLNPCSWFLNDVLAESKVAKFLFGPSNRSMINSCRRLFEMTKPLVVSVDCFELSFKVPSFDCSQMLTDHVRQCSRIDYFVNEVSADLSALKKIAAFLINSYGETDRGKYSGYSSNRLYFNLINCDGPYSVDVLIEDIFFGLPSFKTHGSSFIKTPFSNCRSIEFFKEGGPVDSNDSFPPEEVLDVMPELEASPDTSIPDDKAQSTSMDSSIENSDLELSSLTSPTIRKNDCFFKAVGETIGICPDILINKVINSRESYLENAKKQVIMDQPMGRVFLQPICIFLNLRVHIHYANSVIKLNDVDDLRVINVGGRPGHLFKINESSMPNTIKNQSLISSKTVIASCFSSTFSRGSDAPISIVELSIKKILDLLNSFESMNLGAKIDRRKIRDGRIIDYKVIECLRGLRKGEGKKIRIKAVPCYPFLGFAGSGKSKCLISKLIDGNILQDFHLSAPRKKIIDEIMSDIDQKQFDEREKISKRKSFCTYENSLLSNSPCSSLIFDECGLNPPGFIDLMILKNMITKVGASSFIDEISRTESWVNNEFWVEHDINLTLAFTGDTLQSQFHSESCTKLAKEKNELKYLISLANEKLPYLWGTRRCGHFKNSFSLGFYPDFEASISTLLGFERLESIIGSNQSKYGFITTSRADKDFYDLNFNGIMTINEAQGSTFDAVVLIITKDFFSNPIEALMVAITRHRHALIFVVPESIASEVNAQLTRKPVHCSLINKNFRVLDPILKEMTLVYDLVDELPFGSDFEIKLEGDPFLKAQLNMVDEIVLDQAQITRPTLKENLKTHIPISFDHNLDLEISLMRARECREFKDHQVGWSRQFKDEPNMRDKTDMNYAMMPEAIFPRHFANDDLTFWAAVKKRLIFKNPIQNERDFELAKPFGREMLSLFLSKVKINPAYDESMYNDCVSEFEEKKISKSASMIKAHHARSTTDWPINEIFLFIKSQLCTKQEKMFCDAKAGQTLACFSHMILCKFAPLSRYIEKKVSDALPEQFYIHQKKNFDELEKWVKHFDFDNICTESDYEAFDASQDAFTLAFEFELLKYLGVSNQMISDYVFLKKNLNCKLGNLAIMRFTGEFCTFLFNTLTNMLFTFMTYDLNKATAICFAGDDMCANKRLLKSDRYKKILSHFKLKAKVDYTRSPTFCGWKLSKFGIVKAPKLIKARLDIAIQKQELDNVIDSYFLEHKFAYEKGDHLFEILNESDLEYHYSLTRFFVLNKKKLSGRSREEFDTMNSAEGGLFGECERTFGNPDSFWNGVKRKFKQVELVGKNINFDAKFSDILSNPTLNVYDESFLKNKEPFDESLLQNINDKRVIESYNELNHSMMHAHPELSKMAKWNFVIGRNFTDNISTLDLNLPASFYPFSRSTPLENDLAECCLNKVESIKESYSSPVDSKGEVNLKKLKDFRSLKHGIESNLAERIKECQSFQQKSSLEMSQAKMKGCILTQFQLSQFTRMPQSLTKRYLPLLKGFSHQLLYQPIALVNQTLHNSISLMKWNWRLLGNFQVSTLYCMLERFLYPLLAYLNCATQLLEGCYTSIQDSSNQKMRVKLASKCFYTPARPIFCIDQTTQSQLQIHKSSALQESNLNLTRWKWPKILTSSGLILELFTSSATKPPRRTQLLRKQGKSFKISSERMIYPILPPSYLLKTLMPHQVLPSLILTSSTESEKGVCSEVQLEQLEPGGMKPGAKSKGLSQSSSNPKLDLSQSLLLTWLGQVLIDLIHHKCLFKKQDFQLIKIFLRIIEPTLFQNMSIQEQLQNQIKRELGNYIWQEVIDPHNRLRMTARAAVDAHNGVEAVLAVEPTQNQLVTKSRLKDYYLQVLFGNLAIIGTSSQTDYPNVPLVIERPVIEGQPELTQHLPESISLLEFVQIVKAWGAVGAEERFRNYTLRQLCEPFARQAYTFFRNNRDLASNIFLKNPGSYFDCPQVVFDFNKGLPLDIIKQGNNAKAISACNARLFSREGKKAVFAAQGEVNLTFD